MTASEWRDKNPNKKGNIRDYAEVPQLVCLSNLESLNAYLIQNGICQKERLIELNKAAIHQMKVLAEEASTPSTTIEATENECIIFKK